MTPKTFELCLFWKLIILINGWEAVYEALASLIGLDLGGIQCDQIGCLRAIWELFQTSERFFWRAKSPNNLVLFVEISENAENILHGEKFKRKYAHTVGFWENFSEF